MERCKVCGEYGELFVLAGVLNEALCGKHREEFDVWCLENLMEDVRHNTLGRLRMDIACEKATRDLIPTETAITIAESVLDHEKMMREKIWKYFADKREEQ